MEKIKIIKKSCYFLKNFFKKNKKKDEKKLEGSKN